jgi:hypothetical protein
VYEVGRAELGQEGWYYICEKDDALGDVGADEVEGSGEDDNVEDIVDEAWTWRLVRDVWCVVCGVWCVLRVLLEDRNGHVQRRRGELALFASQCCCECYPGTPLCHDLRLLWSTSRQGAHRTTRMLRTLLD